MPFSPLSYNVINWKNRSEALTTPLGKTNLNKMDSMIFNLVQQLNMAYNELNEGKASYEDIDGMVKKIEYDRDTGIWKFFLFNRTSPQEIDLNVEKIPVNFSMDNNAVITMETADGTKYTADLKQVIPIIKKADTATIEMSVSSSGVDRTISASIKKNSITGDYLQPNYLADITTQAQTATAQAQLASGYANNAAYDAKLSQSYSVGGSGIRDGEDTDNALYYKNLTQSLKSDVIQLKSDTEGYKNDARTSADNAYASEANARESEQNAALSEQNAAISESAAALSAANALQSENNAKISETNAKTSEDNAKLSENNAKDSEDNAKQSELSAKSYFDQVKEISDNEKEILDEINQKLEISTFSVDSNGNLVYSDNGAYTFVVDDNGDLNYSLAP